MQGARDLLRRLGLDPEALRRHRWLRRFGPVLERPCLWRVSRRGIALGVALGVFFGLLIPVAQMPVAAGAAILLRANLPSALASTLVTNPATVAPVYWLSWKVGLRVLGEEPQRVARADGGHAAPGEAAPEAASGWLARATSLGRPLLAGLAVVATMAGLAAYLLVDLGWRLWSLVGRRRRGGG